MMISKVRIDGILAELVCMSQESSRNGRLPITAILANETQILSRGYSDTGGPLDHAELRCINSLGANKAPDGAVLVTTVEPCVMCLGAAKNFGIENVLFVCDAYLDGGTWCLHSPTTDLTSHQRHSQTDFYRDFNVLKVGQGRKKEFIACFEKYLDASESDVLNAYVNGLLEQEYGTS